ncbi:uncharacterized protein LOC127279840 isoform X2 [Leptopilina boulardi]|uniref:uncharacterized protein LOC127279840 isoform X2 n=1 Tax=Leptopilina boulardi TaxID=63433 RepID=UPI0021F69845|nr:uncharacterized protein LOC127279840 isoform X2 [Leptopilina boulardi]
MCEYFNGTPSQEISSVEKSEIGSGVLPFNRAETKASFVRGNNRFSLFKWLKRGNRDSIDKHRKRISNKNINFEEENLSSSTDSVSTFYSTTTVHSFAFQAGEFQECNDLNLNFPQIDIGPFGSGAVKLYEKTANNSNFTNINYTLPNKFLQKKDITERYSLQPSNSFNSCGNIPAPVNNWKKSCIKNKKVHVKGKRRAPNPPDFIPTSNAKQSFKTTKKRTRRRAPPPPDENLKIDKIIKTNGDITKEILPTISNDTLILRDGILLPKNSTDCTNINSEETISDVEISQGKEIHSKSFDRTMPRPWYKRSVFDRDSNTVKRDISSSSEKKEDSSSPYFPFDGSLSKLNFFHRTERNSEDRRRDKRKSGISILTNISELDKEAAAIVREEQAKAKALQDENLNIEKIQDMVESTSSPRKSTRALISKFNAITNLSKVTVNTNYFSKNSPTSQRNNDRIRVQSKNSCLEQKIEQKQDISRYFIPHQTSPKSHFNQNKIELNKNDQVEIEKIIEPENSQKEERNGTNEIQNTESLFNKKYSLNKKIFHDNNPPPLIIRELDLIFNEIDKQLENNIKKSRINNSKIEKASTSDQILNFLIESKETGKRTNNVEQTLEKELIHNQNRNSKENLSILNKQDDPATMDLKEILKEMKHSLPKRAKVKKIIDNHSEIFNVNNKPSTSTFNDLNAFTTTTNLKENILEKSKTRLASQEKFITDVREEKKLKVSSAVQTSGNVRKVSNLPSTSRQITNQETFTKSEYETGTKYKINKFHLIRPKEFDQIEAIKLVKTPWLENIYANVTQQPSCSNKIILPLRPIINVQPSELLLKRKEEVDKKNYPLSAKLNQQEISLPLTGGKYEQRNFNDSQKQNMNTLAVNKLLKKLEASIASGNHQQASKLAKELAELKIQCSVIRQRSINNTRELNVNMYIEDKEAHQGPIPLLLPLNMTVAQLKAKISLEFEIPTNIQRWIIGKNLAENENSTLEELQTTDSIFLYLVAPALEMTSDEVTKPEKSNAVEEIEKLNIKQIETIPETKVTIEETQKKYEENLEIILTNDKTPENVPEIIKLERYEELMSLENCDLIPNSEAIECPICFVTYGPQEGVTLRDCLHTFCRLCITNTIVYCEEAEVQCPYRDSMYTCESTLQEREIKAYIYPLVTLTYSLWRQKFISNIYPSPLHKLRTMLGIMRFTARHPTVQDGAFTMTMSTIFFVPCVT